MAPSYVTPPINQNRNHLLAAFVATFAGNISSIMSDK
jgi:hypothetical protein